MNANTSQKPAVLLLTADEQEGQRFRHEFAHELEVVVANTPGQALGLCAQQPAAFVAVLNAADPASDLGLSLVRVLREEQHLALPVLWLTKKAVPPALQALLLADLGSEVFLVPADHERLLIRLLFRVYVPTMPAASAEVYALRIPLGKRAVDVVCAGSALLLLAPFLLVLAALIKLESRGPVFYYSYRVGAGYKIFKFWKLRSMCSGADLLLDSIKNLNQYQAEAAAAGPQVAFTGLCAACAAAGSRCQQQLVNERGQLICEQQYRDQQKAAKAPAFIKIANDPRVTRLGRFLRNTSIDELPQLYNVLRGDMSLVGNRPLPLYEAEKLLTDAHSWRFIAPAGITGLWQVTRRGKGGNMSEEERKALDVEYARSFSMKKDLEIILKTIPALFQKENV